MPRARSTHQLLSIERLRELFLYDPVAGTLIRRITTASTAAAGTIAGRTDCLGYRTVCADGLSFMCHRVVWAMHYGEWPKDQIDHINGVRDDNRIANLRDVDAKINGQNRRKARANSSTGFLGVTAPASMATLRTPYAAAIYVDSKRVLLGKFETAEAAHAAYVEAKRRLHEGCTL